MGHVPFTFGEGASFRVRHARPFSVVNYHCSARPEDLDEAVLSTFRHTVFDLLFFLCCVVGYGSVWGSGSPQSACPSLS